MQSYTKKFQDLYIELRNYSGYLEIPCTVMKPAALWLFNSSVNNSSPSHNTHDSTAPVTAMWLRVTVDENHEMLCHPGSCDHVFMLLFEVTIR